MKLRQLFVKELKLALNPNVIIMTALSVTILIPSYPAFAAIVYLLAGLFSIMPRALADKDIEYTSMLPVPKKGVVVAKIMLFVSLELATTLLTVPFAFIRNLVTDPMIVAAGASEETKVSMLAFEPSLTTYGFAFFIFGFYNILFFPWYYKNPSKINLPQTVTTIITMVVAVILIVLPLIGPLGSLLSYQGALSNPTALYTQIGILVGGAVIGALLTFFSIKLASKHFEKVDI
jgi:hypothetical protein